MNIINILKENNQDFEFYPTTKEIIEVVKKDIEGEKASSMLDIGAGDGRVLESMPIYKKYAIEKSKILIEQLNKDIFIIGTDFNQQTLIDKKVDVIF